MKRSGKKVSSGLQFNHAMVYSADVARALGFYCDRLGFRLLETYAHAGRPVYARIRPPQGNSTMALHQADGEWRAGPGGGMRLYFEVRDLERFCARLAKRGVRFKQLPKKMPWGWKHAYLDDPDGYEVSLYWAGRQRLMSRREEK
jgi:catechol 2,3-dioxygenase-like lactoylglutathione lyase family enzyme